MKCANTIPFGPLMHSQGNRYQEQKVQNKQGFVMWNLSGCLMNIMMFRFDQVWKFG